MVLHYFTRFVWVPLLFVNLLLGGSSAAFAENKGQGTLVVEALGEGGQSSSTQAHLYPVNSQTPVATVKMGAPVNLPPGTYRLELDVLGGKIKRDNVLVKAGRTSTVIINEVAGLHISALDKKGNELGLGVEVYDPTSGQKLGDFLSGETIFAYPGMLDVKVATPPQGQWYRQVQLKGNTLSTLELREQIRGQLRVYPLLEGKDVSAATEVVIYQAGTQKAVARSTPAAEHRFSLDTGAYDIYVQNATGRGKPFVIDRVEIQGEGTVEKNVPLDAGAAPQRVPATPSQPSQEQTL
ncbi:MAG: hypothetical protein FJ147_10870 [Deltaproteobacteria bacterium]|nr:hypothetical protein [Deltaproteobacteria bacterium]